MLKSKVIIPFEVSKWIKIPLLVDVSEMEELLTNYAPPFKIYSVQRVTQQGEGVEDSELFLQHYAEYVAYLKKGELPPLAKFRSLFSVVWSVSEEALYSLEAGENRQLIKASKPVVQMQINQIHYSREDKQFRTQVFGAESIFWGIQLGFPNLFLDPKTYEVSKTREFPNMELFHAIQLWVRKMTKPTPFIVDGEKIKAPIRLGKACFSWISSHPQLKEQGIEVETT